MNGKLDPVVREVTPMTWLLCFRVITCLVVHPAYMKVLCRPMLTMVLYLDRSTLRTGPTRQLTLVPPMRTLSLLQCLMAVVMMVLIRVLLSMLSVTVA